MKRNYGRVTREIIEELTAIVGKRNITTDKSEMEGYSSDEAPLAKRRFPQVVVKPADGGSVASVLALANKKRIPVTPRGAGTGLSGGCIPIYGGILLSLERMNRILEIDEDNFLAIVEAGVALSDLYHQVEERGLAYPLYPGEMAATIGGNVATNAGGMKAVKYGVTRHHILGLEAVLPNGEIVNTGGEFVKCSTGYDLTQLIMGSEGTLAVVTKVILKLTTKPARREVLFVPFMNLQDAINAVPGILRLKMVPVGLEFMEKGIIEIVERYTGKELPYHDYEAFLMIIMEGESEDEIHGYFSQVDEICKQHGAVAAMIPGSERAKRRLLDAREKFYLAIKKSAPMDIADVVVPRTAIAGFVRRVKEISEEHQVPVIVYGHAGDGNVHLHPVCVNMSREEWDRRRSHLMRQIYRAGVSLGGAISGEHGIGCDKKAYLPIQMDEACLSIMKGIKKAFDPNNILNPGKIFDL
ncbi:putative FAD-linked oxidoreductase [subsurface metagenome]